MKRKEETSGGWHAVYQEGLKRIIATIREHSPEAKIVLALTTPSPFDSNATIPDEATCPHYDKFLPAGIVPMMNRLAEEVALETNVTINDRYSAVYPNLKELQKPCDIHFSSAAAAAAAAAGGDKVLAQQDWKVASSLLGLPST